MPYKEKIMTVTIDDCKVETFRAGGKGGQNQNKRDTGVRVRHEPSGAVGESREERSQLQNKQNAFARMANTPQFRAWVAEIADPRKHRTIDDILDDMTAPENLIVEYGPFK